MLTLTWSPGPHQSDLFVSLIAYFSSCAENVYIRTGFAFLPCYHNNYIPAYVRGKYPIGFSCTGVNSPLLEDRLLLRCLPQQGSETPLILMWKV